MNTKQITKTVYEDFFRCHNFKRTPLPGWLPDGETISTCAVTAYETVSGTDVSAAMISDAAPYSNTKARYRIKAGEADKTYRIIIRIVTSAGQKLEDWIECEVK